MLFRTMLSWALTMIAFAWMKIKLKFVQPKSTECDANSSFSSLCANFNCGKEKINVFDSHVVLFTHDIALDNMWVMIPSTSSKVQIAQPTHESWFFNNVSIVNCNFANDEDLKNFLCLRFLCNVSFKSSFHRVGKTISPNLIVKGWLPWINHNYLFRMLCWSHIKLLHIIVFEIIICP